MELVKHNGPIVTEGATRIVNFGIANNAKMFRILSDTMYKDKPGSIVREISCNALDGHTAAGNLDKPFVIHLPDAFEPWFSVRDFGTGLSPEAVEKIFCMYGESTKDQSNEAIGAFGLGAKTPFSYSDQFTVTSYVNGKCNTYSAFINGDGIPQLSLMVDNVDTDEPNGVEVHMAVKPEDFNRFMVAVRTQLRFFPVKPTIRNCKSFAWMEEPETLFQTDVIRVYRAAGYGNNKVHIVQGPVGYPLDFNQINPFLSPEASKFLRTMSEVGAALYVPIGAIGVTASREDVEYKGQTIDTLKAIIDKGYNDLVAWAEKEVKSLKTPWEKALFINENATFRNIISGIKMDCAPAEKARSGEYTFNIGGCDAYNVEVEEVLFNGDKVKRTFSGAAITEFNRSAMSGFTGSRYSSPDALLLPKKNMKVAIAFRSATDKSKPLARMRHFFAEKGLEKMYGVVMHESITVDQKFVDKVRKHLGGFAEIYLVSEMADPPKAVYERTRADYSRPTVYLASGNGRDDMDSVANWERVYTKLGELENDAGDELEKAIYVTVDRQRIESIPHEFKRLYQDLCLAGVVKIPLYAVRVADVAKLAGTPTEWIKLEDFVKEKKAEVMANPAIRRYSIANAISESVNMTLGNRVDGLTGLNGRTRLARLRRIGDKAKGIAVASQVNNAMLRIAGYDVDKHPALSIVRSMGAKVFERTPMVKTLIRSGYGVIDGDEAKHMVEYINHFDR